MTRISIFIYFIFLNIIGGKVALFLIVLEVLAAEFVDLTDCLDPYHLVLTEIGGQQVQILVVFSLVLVVILLSFFSVTFHYGTHENISQEP